MVTAAIKRSAEKLQGQPRVVVCVGSGLSAESGVPTFRGPAGITYEADVARLTRVETFLSDQRMEMLAWYQERRELLRGLEPNPGHHALVSLAQTGEYLIATQNVDHLLEVASEAQGYRPEILHLHGSLLEVKCHDCGHSFEDLWFDLSAGPRCELCGGPFRPGVVWFGEGLPDGTLERSLEAAKNADVCLILGTSGLVYPAALIPEIARRFGATLIEVNPNRSEFSDMAEIVVRGKTGEVLPEISRRVELQ